MTAICGVFARDGRTVAAAELDPMLAALAHRGIDRSSARLFGAAGFGVQQLFITPESQLSEQPYLDEESGLAIVADCRIDNREEVLAWLGLEHARALTMPDELVFLLAFKKAGEAALDRVVGEFACALFDSRQRELLCISDAMGTKRLCYRDEPGRFLFATEAKGILAAPGVPRRLDERKLARSAFALSQQLDRRSTFFEGLVSLPAATLLRVDCSSKSERSYWSLDVAKPLAFRSDQDWLDEVRASLTTAIDARLRSGHPSAVLLSGGLDSSAITCLASKLARDRGQRLTALSAVSAREFAGRFPDEREFIEAFADEASLTMSFVDDAEPGPFDTLDRLVWLNDSPLGTSRHYLYSAFASHARAVGARVILDGQFGELGPSFTGQGILAELAARGRLMALASQISQRRSRRPEPLWALIKGEVLRPLLPAHWLRAIGRGRLRRDIEQFRLGGFLREEYLRAVLGGELDELGERTRTLLETRPLHRLNQSRAIELARGSGGGRFEGAEHVSLERPFRDRRLLETCLAAPIHLKFGRGFDRMLVRRALDGLLPSKIQWRTTKLPFSPDYPARYNRDRSKALEIIASAGPSVAERLDLERLRGAIAVEMTDSRGRTPADFAAMHTIPAAVRMAVFVGSLSA